MTGLAIIIVALLVIWFIEAGIDYVIDWWTLRK